MTKFTARFSKPARPLTRREREDLADALYRRRAEARLLTCRVVDSQWEPIAPDLDLIVTAHTLEEARHVWERWATDVAGAEGKVQLAITYTAPAISSRSRPKEVTSGYQVDLDRLAFEDEYDAAIDLETSTSMF
ncbi:hypothetical protein MKK68_21140 [Methylobacterium sp. E-016]|uniref:hypothetical protein n=1 Tax=Methylobacterium sp. E-016 TaxID=2836556 RepID=UPI001FB94085|nr:hypothetical protein [Methylobacterium sp. E-016]MCJ2078119.1 hypothetical protein [Methylobacterium sp. E-016]